MSALTPQIKSHRAMEQALLESAGNCREPMISAMLREMAIVHHNAAKELEADEEAIRPPLDGQDKPVDFNPRRRSGAQ